MAKSVSIISVIGMAFSLIKKEYFIVVPGIISSFLLYALQMLLLPSDLSKLTLNLNLIILFTIFSIINFFFFIVTSSFINDLLNDSPLDIKTTIIESLKRFPKLILACAILILPTTALIYMSVNYLQSLEQLHVILKSLSIFIQLMLQVVMIIAVLSMTFLPAIFTSKSVGITTAIYKSFNFLKNHKLVSLLLICMIINIHIVMIIFALPFSKIPVIGSGVIVRVIDGFKNYFVYALATLGYLAAIKNANQQQLDNAEDTNTL